jgi:hypothetical protein
MYYLPPLPDKVALFLSLVSCRILIQAIFEMIEIIIWKIRVIVLVRRIAIVSVSSLLPLSGHMCYNNIYAFSLVILSRHQADSCKDPQHSAKTKFSSECPLIHSYISSDTSSSRNPKIGSSPRLPAMLLFHVQIARWMCCC